MLFVAVAKNSPMAIEALAGLASQEDFAAIQLRKTAESTVHLSPMLPYKELMLLQVKGRRHVQTRLVRPHYTSVNRGDSYVLVTPSQVEKAYLLCCLIIRHENPVTSHVKPDKLDLDLLIKFNLFCQLPEYESRRVALCPST